MAKKPSTDKTLPNMANYTPGGIIDMLGDTRVEIKRLQFLEGVYKEALKARATELQLKGESLLKGEKYVGKYSKKTQERIAADLVREVLKDKPAELAKCFKEIAFLQLDIDPREDQL
jgi:hypothetical protein